jgi:hypothetical protein
MSRTNHPEPCASQRLYDAAAPTRRLKLLGGEWFLLEGAEVLTGPFDSPRDVEDWLDAEGGDE